MASTTVGALIVKLTANTRQFDTAMKRAPKQVTALQKSTGAATAALGTMVTRLGAVAAGYLSARMAVGSFMQSAARLDELGKYSDRIGINVEALQRLHHAAGLSGVEIKALHMALQKMVGNVSEAAQGTGEAKDAIAELRLEAKTLATLSPENQFLRIAAALQRVKSQTERVRLMGDITGERGVRMLQLLVDLQSKLARADVAGIFTREQIARVEAMNDAWLEAKESMGAAARTMTVELAPAIKAVAEAITWSVSKTKEGMAGWKSLTATMELGIARATGSPKLQRLAKQHYLEALTGFPSGVGPLAQMALNLQKPGAGVTPKPSVAGIEGPTWGEVLERRANMRRWTDYLAGQRWFKANVAEYERMQPVRARIANVMAGMAPPMGAGPAQFVGATGGRGTAGFYEMQARAQFKAPREDTQKSILEVLREQLELERDRERQIDELIDKLTPQELMAIPGGAEY